MNRAYGDAHYSTASVRDNKKGCTGLELWRARNGKQDKVANIMFWDASGQFFVETFNADVPLSIFEEMIAEAKATIKIK